MENVRKGERDLIKSALLIIFLTVFVACGGDGMVELQIAPEPKLELVTELETEAIIEIKTEIEAEIEIEVAIETEVEAEVETKIEVEIAIEIEAEADYTPVDLAMHALWQILSVINITEGESGAFDIDINLETGMDDGTGLQHNIVMDINMKKISDGSYVELLTTMDLDLGDIMGGFFRGTELNIGTYSLVRGYEVLDSRLIVSGMELTPETINTFGLDDMLTLGGFSIEDVMLDMLRQNLTISREALEELEIRIEPPYMGEWSVQIWGEEAELDFALAMLPIDTQGVELGEALIFLNMYEENPPHRAIIEIYWEMPVGGNTAQFFAVIRVHFNATGDAVVIELP